MGVIKKLKKFSKKKISRLWKLIKSKLWVFSFKKPPSISRLNDDCLEAVFENLNEAELAKVGVLRNNRIRFLVTRVFKRKFGRTLRITNGTLDGSVNIMRAFGDVIESLEIIFQMNEVLDIIGHLKRVSCHKIKNLTLRFEPGGQVPDESARQDIFLFLDEMASVFPKLSCLRVDHQSEHYVDYFSLLPLIPGLTSLVVSGNVYLTGVWTVLTDLLKWETEAIVESGVMSIVFRKK